MLVLIQSVEHLFACLRNIPVANYKIGTGTGTHKDKPKKLNQGTWTAKTIQ
jgi:hypothetical protein